MLRFVVLAVVACYLAEAMPGGAGGYGAGAGYAYHAKAAPNNGYEADINKNNAARQLGVNRNAQYVGSGSGTARLDGVPGTPLGRTGHDRYSYGSGYGNAGYGKGGYGNARHGNAGYGNAGYGNTGYGNTGYGNSGYGHGAVGYANNHAAYAKGSGYGNAGHRGY